MHLKVAWGFPQLHLIDRVQLVPLDPQNAQVTLAEDEASFFYYIGFLYGLKVAQVLIDWVIYGLISLLQFICSKSKRPVVQKGCYYLAVLLRTQLGPGAVEVHLNGNHSKET